MPVETFLCYVRLSENDKSLAHFKKRLWKEGLQLREVQLGLENCILLVGYSKRQEGQCYLNFTESFTDAQWCIALSKVLHDYDLVITVRVVQAKVVSSVSKVQPGVKPVAWALSNQLKDQHNQDQAQSVKEHKEKPTGQQPRPEIVTPSLEALDSSVALSIDKEEYYVDSFNVIETEEFAIEENEFTLDTFSTTDCSPPKQPRLMNTESRQVTVDCPIETSSPPIILYQSPIMGHLIQQ